MSGRNRQAWASALMFGALFCSVLCSHALASGDANSSACANGAMPGFRAYLPDCRAYEMVTPPYKGGDYVELDSVSLTSSGDEALGEALAKLGEAAPGVFYGVFTPYAFHRAGGGWTTAPLLTSTAALQRPGQTISKVLFRHRDETSGQTLWEVFYVPSGGMGYAQDFFYIEKADGSVVELGPVHPGPIAPNNSGTGSSPQAVAVSPGMGRLVFKSESEELLPREAWAGDTTVKGSPSLYEYTTGESREPRLVGVRNQYMLRSNTEAELISSCGTSLGANTGEKQGALSQDGRTVIFTADRGQGSACAGPPVNQIYARIDGARTVAISEPSHEDCRECNTTTGLDDALYRGASADGTRIYFTTSQELLPGAKGSNLYVYDFGKGAGQRVSLISTGASEPSVQGVLRISQDGSHVYFVATGALTGANAEARAPVVGSSNLYVFRQDSRVPAGRLTFIATLAQGDSSDWGEGDFQRPAAVTPSGDYLVFTSSADLTSDDTSSQRQLFAYDAQAQSLVRISVGQRSPSYAGGYHENGNTTNEVDQVTVATPSYAELGNATGQATRTMSDDGHDIFFETPLALTPQAADNLKAGRACSYGVESEAGECLFGETPVYMQNVYEYRWSTRMSDGNVYLIADGRAPSMFYEGARTPLLGTDRSGANVFFLSTQALVPQHADSQMTVYDAREGGGFEEPVTAAGCSATSCERAVTHAPQITAPGSASWPAGENLAPAAPRSSGAKSRRLSRADSLSRALRACRDRPRKRRRICEATARRRVGRMVSERGRSHGR
jgi:hypothetical protein